MMHRNKIIPHYLGSKNVNGVYQFIISRIPKHKTYIEGFLGGGNIYLFKQRSSQSILIDKDAAVIDKFRSIIDKRVKLITSGFIDAIDQLNSMALIDSFIYLDPPYLDFTRTGTHRYKYEMSVLDHIDLLEFVKRQPGYIAISCYDNKLYSSMLQQWKKEDYVSITRQGKRVETLYMNYDISQLQLHETTYIGKDFTDRQRIKRKCDRLIKKISMLPREEQQRIIDSVRLSTITAASSIDISIRTAN